MSVSDRAVIAESHTRRDGDTSREGSSSNEEVHSWSVKKMREELRKRNKPVSGTKAELLDRLVAGPSSEKGIKQRKAQIPLFKLHNPFLHEESNVLMEGQPKCGGVTVEPVEDTCPVSQLLPRQRLDSRDLSRTRESPMNLKDVVIDHQKEPKRSKNFMDDLSDNDFEALQSDDSDEHENYNTGQMKNKYKPMSKYFKKKVADINSKSSKHTETSIPPFKPQFPCRKKKVENSDKSTSDKRVTGTIDDDNSNYNDFHQQIQNNPFSSYIPLDEINIEGDFTAASEKVICETNPSAQKMFTVAETNVAEDSSTQPLILESLSSCSNEPVQQKVNIEEQRGEKEHLFDKEKPADTEEHPANQIELPDANSEPSTINTEDQGGRTVEFMLDVDTLSIPSLIGIIQSQQTTIEGLQRSNQVLNKSIEEQHKTIHFLMLELARRGNNTENNSENVMNIGQEVEVMEESVQIDAENAMDNNDDGSELEVNGQEFHVETSLPNNTPKKVECLKCNKEFCDIRVLKRHIKRFHEVERKCDKCEKTFSTDNLLKQHKKNHNGFPCEYCGKIFLTCDSCRKHRNKYCKKRKLGEKSKKKRSLNEGSVRQVPSEESQPAVFDVESQLEVQHHS